MKQLNNADPLTFLTSLRSVFKALSNVFVGPLL